MAEDVGEDGGEIVGLAAATGEVGAGQGVGMDDLEIEHRGVFLAGGRDGAAAQGGQRAADEAAENLVEERQPVALVAAEGQQRRHQIGIGGGVARGIHRGPRRQRFAFALERLDPPHGHRGGGPINDNGKPVSLRGGNAPRVRVGAEGGKFAAEGHHFRQRGGAVGVGEIAALSGGHDVAAAPQIVEGIVHGNLRNAELVGQFDGALDRPIGHRLAEFFVSIPAFRGGEAAGQHGDLRGGDAAADARPEQVVEVQRLEGVVGADAVAGRFGGELGAFGRFRGGEAAGLIGPAHKQVVGGAGDDEEGAHG